MKPKRQPLNYNEIITKALILVIGLGLITASLYNILHK
jgi:hypothetical protein